MRQTASWVQQNTHTCSSCSRADAGAEAALAAVLPSTSACSQKGCMLGRLLLQAHHMHIVQPQQWALTAAHLGFGCVLRPLR